MKLESVHPGRTRYLVVVSCTGRQDAEESCLLGIDCHTRATVGLVLRVLADTAITLDGDGYVAHFYVFLSLSFSILSPLIATLHLSLSLSLLLSFSRIEKEYVYAQYRFIKRAVPLHQAAAI